VIEPNRPVTRWPVRRCKGGVLQDMSHMYARISAIEDLFGNPRMLARDYAETWDQASKSQVARGRRVKLPRFRGTTSPHKTKKNGEFMKTLLGLALMIFLSGCAATLPSHVNVNNDYNILNAKTTSVNVECLNVKTDNIDPESVPDYCMMMQGAVKVAMRAKSGLKLSDDNPDVLVNIKIEEIYGGNAHARFWVGLGAGRSALTTYTKVMQAGNLIAEMRKTETSTMPNLNSGTWSNEEVLSQDVSISASKIADFIINPKSFLAQPSNTQ
jgi:hypothetical protein